MDSPGKTDDNQSMNQDDRMGTLSMNQDNVVTESINKDDKSDTRIMNHDDRNSTQSISQDDIHIIDTVSMNQEHNTGAEFMNQGSRKHALLDHSYSYQCHVCLVTFPTYKELSLHRNFCPKVKFMDGWSEDSDSESD